LKSMHADLGGKRGFENLTSGKKRKIKPRLLVNYRGGGGGGSKPTYLFKSQCRGKKERAKSFMGLKVQEI